MNNNQNQPREFDVVLGGKNPPPVTGVVLGGIEGVKQRLESEIVDVRIKALNDAFKYGDEGLDLVIQALENDSLQVQGFASRLLKEWGGEKGKQALLEFDPYLYFTKLDDWDYIKINLNANIPETVNNAYIIMNSDSLVALCQKPYCNNIEALQCQYGDNFQTVFADSLINVSEKLKKLKALYIGDMIMNTKLLMLY